MDGAPKKTGKNDLVRTGIIVVVIIVFVAAIIILGGKEATAPEDVASEEGSNEERGGVENGQSTPAGGTGIQAGESLVASFSVPAQSAGNSVLLSSLTVSEPLWFAVYETNEAGEKGNILGARRVHPGESSREVALLRRTEPGQAYYVVVHANDGDGDFEFKTDDLPLKTDGRIIEARFVAE